MTTKHETVGPCGRSERESGEHFDKAHWGQAADATWFDMFDRRQREQTAATILAALVQAPEDSWGHGIAVNNDEMAANAVLLADALRAALKGGA
jgi:hypothetical protein